MILEPENTQRSGTGGPTIDELYEAFMDIGAWGTEGEFGAKPFAEDIFDFFDLGRKGWDVGEWTKDYGVYLPSFDPAGIKLAGREKEIDYQKAMDTLDITQDVADRVYATELDTLSTELGREMEKGKTVAGGLGLRSGFLESAVEDTLERSATKTKDLGDRLMLSEDEMLNTYNTAMVDATLDFDKTKREEKEAFYDRTMRMIAKLTEQDAFGPTADVGLGGIDESDLTMANNIEACIATLGPQPAPGTPEFTQWSEQRADCEGVPFIQPDITEEGDIIYDPGDFDFNIGGFGSDIRLKEEIEHIGHSPSGLKIYEFSYIGMNGRYQGVMSHEIPEEAVIKDSNGYDRVNYNMIDVDFKRID